MPKDKPSERSSLEWIDPQGNHIDLTFWRKPGEFPNPETARLLAEAGISPFLYAAHVKLVWLAAPYGAVLALGEQQPYGVLPSGSTFSVDYRLQTVSWTGDPDQQLQADLERALADVRAASHDPDTLVEWADQHPPPIAVPQRNSVKRKSRSGLDFDALQQVLRSDHHLLFDHAITGLIDEAYSRAGDRTIAIRNQVVIGPQRLIDLDQVRAYGRAEGLFRISKRAQFRYILALYEIAYAVHVLGQGEQIEREAHPKVLGRGTWVHLILRAAIDYYAEAEAPGLPPEHRQALRNNASKRLSDDAKAINNLLAAELTPAQARALSNEPGQTLDLWRRTPDILAPTPGKTRTGSLSGDPSPPIRQLRGCSLTPGDYLYALIRRSPDHAIDQVYEIADASDSRSLRSLMRAPFWFRDGLAASSAPPSPPMKKRKVRLILRNSGL